jgi:hypothetical protein
MNYITPQQFQKYFKVQGKTVAVTPSASLCSRSLGHNVDYDTEKVHYYDTVLVDIVEGMKFEGYKARYQYLWLKTAVDYAKSGGKIYVKGPSNILNQILRLSTKVFVEKIIMEGSNAFLQISSEKPNQRKTFVKYDTEEEISFDISKSILPLKYSQKDLEYVTSVDSSPEEKDYCRRECVAGRQRHLFFDFYNESMEDHTHGLLIQNNCKNLQVSKLEDQSCNSSADVYFFQSKEVRDKYYNIFQQYDIIKLANNLACGGEMTKKVQSYLMTPHIFQYAISN